MKNVIPKKSLGQHFLQDKKALGQIVSAADLQVDDKVLEFGPGTGVLTNVLTNVITSGKLIAIEKDSNLANKLARNFQFSIFNFSAKGGPAAGWQSISNDPILNFENRAAVVTGDVLEINLPKLIEQNDFQDYKVVANIPYYITGKIIRLLFETKYVPKLIVLLVQKEVAERICAKPGKMNRLSAIVQYFGAPEIIATVGKESFNPPPEVDSAILKIVPHRNGYYERGADEESLLRLIKIGFSSPRKKLLNNLSSGMKISKDETKKLLEKSEIDSTVRAQDLEIEDWERVLLNTRSQVLF